MFPNVFKLVVLQEINFGPLMCFSSRSNISRSVTYCYIVAAIENLT